MVEKDTSPKQKVAAILNIIAGVLFLGAGFNIFGASPGPSWIWLVFAVFFVFAGVWGLFR